VLKASNPDVMFTYFGDVDAVGHEEGFHPTIGPYVKEVEQVDGQVGRVLDALRNRPTYEQEDWLIVCTTDHGGTKHGHFKSSDPDNHTVFYIVNGKNVDSSIVPGKLGLVDIVPTVYSHLGVPIDPAWGLDGQAVGFRSEKCSKN